MEKKIEEYDDDDGEEEGWLQNAISLEVKF